MEPAVCFLCRSDSVPPISTHLSNYDQILSEIVATFCNCMRIHVYTFQRFGKLWFPFCEECRLYLMHLHRLNCDIETLQRSMGQVTTQIFSKIISSTSAEDSVRISMGNRLSQPQDQLDLIRKDIVRSYCPTVSLRRLGFCKVPDEPVAVEVIKISEDFVDTATDATGGIENLNDHDAHLLDTYQNVASVEGCNNIDSGNTFPQHQDSEVAVTVDQSSSHLEITNTGAQIAEKTAEESVQEATSDKQKPRRKRKKRKDREPIVYRKPEHTPDELEEVSNTDFVYRKTFLIKKAAGSLARYICPICDVTPKGLDDVIRHIRRSHLGEVPYQRGMIKMLEIAPNVLDYGGFTATKTPDGRYKCNSCGFLTQTRKYVRVHLRDRHLLKVRPECRLAKPWYFCHLCGNGKRFAQQKILGAHIATHSTIKDKKCNLCGKTYKSSTALYQHKHKAHGKDSGTTFECGNCKKQINGICKYRIHVRRCTSKKDFICDICQKKYNSMPGLEHHMDHHKGTKYLCDYCGMDFAQQASLDRHKRNIHKVKAQNPNSSTHVEDG